MPLLTVYRIATGAIVIGFILRYILNERRIETERTRAIETATQARVGPWRDWAEWRAHIIESEFSTNGT